MRVDRHGRDLGAPTGSELAEYPALWRRAGAGAIDGAIVCSLLWCGVLALLTAFTPTGSRADAFGLGSVSAPNPVIVIFLLLAWLWLTGLGLCYFPFEEGRAGQTIGKRLFGLRVVRSADGRPLGAATAWVRYLARITDLTGIGLLWSMIDPQRRTLHDLIAGTVVVATSRGVEPAGAARRLLRRFVVVLAVLDSLGIVLLTLVVVDALRTSA